MILSIDSNDANSAPLHKKTISSLSGAVESMMKKLEDVGVLVARILMPILFITAGWGKITGYAGTQQYMEAMGVPGFMLPLVILLEFGGGNPVRFPDTYHSPVYCGLYAADGIFISQQLCRRHELADVYEKPDYFWRIPAAGNYRSRRIQHRPPAE